MKQAMIWGILALLAIALVLILDAIRIISNDDNDGDKKS
jgi:hypothetical protein